MLVYRSLDDLDSSYKVDNFDTANKLLPAILLVITILLFRCQVSRLRTRTFFSREKLMLVHTAIFLTYLLAYVTNLTLQTERSRVEVYTVLECRLLVSDYFFIWLYTASDVAILVLFTYMSVKFS